MSPEERAAEIVESVIASGDYERASGIIASAIREAEASARNEALEEAAVALETGITETKASGGVAISRSPWAASVVRSLKSKQEG